MENSMGTPQKTKNTFALAIPLLSIYPKECKPDCNKDTCTSMFIAALLTISKLWKQPRCFTTDKWIKKM
jgi:hypothetical protein